MVVLNRNDYANEIYNELKDNDTYTEIDTDITTKIENKIMWMIFGDFGIMD